MENMVCLIINRPVDFKQRIRDYNIIFSSKELDMENKLLEFLNRLVESGVQFEGLDEAIDYCIERGLI